MGLIPVNVPTAVIVFLPSLELMISCDIDLPIKKKKEKEHIIIIILAARHV